MIQNHSSGFSLFGLQFPLFQAISEDESCDCSHHSTLDTTDSRASKTQILKSVRFSDEVRLGIFEQQHDITVSDCWYSLADVTRFRHEQARALEQVVIRKPEMERLLHGIFTSHFVLEDQLRALCQALGGNRIGLVEELGIFKAEERRRKLVRILSQHRPGKEVQTLHACEALTEQSRAYAIRTAHAHTANLYCC